MSIRTCLKKSHNIKDKYDECVGVNGCFVVKYFHVQKKSFFPAKQNAWGNFRHSQKLKFLHNSVSGKNCPQQYLWV